MTIRGNAFYHYPCQSNRHMQVGSATINELYIESNVFESGESVDTDTRLKGQYQCVP